MNNLNLLFDYRGAISNLQFKRGIYILCVVCGLVILFNSFRFFDYYITSSNEWLIEERLIEILFDNFTPSFIQLGFIIFYSSFVLVIKRGRTLGFSQFKCLIYALFVYSFFVGIPVIITLGTRFWYKTTQDYFPLAYTLIGSAIIIGCICIFHLFKNMKGGVENRSPLVSQINYTKVSIISIAILLLSFTYYIIISSQELQFTIIEKAILENTRNLVVYILAAWLVFRIVVPDCTEKNTHFSLFDNHIIRLLFDWKGSITKREFWCGISIICISILCFNEGTVWQEIRGALISNNYKGEGFEKMTQLQSLLFQFTPSFFPSGCIIFYSSILICIKRCRALHINTLLGYSLSVSFFLCIASVQASVEIMEASQDENKYPILAAGCLIVFGITFLFNIIGITILSQKTKNNSDSWNIDNNTTSYIINNGWLILGYIFLTIAIRFVHYDSDLINQSIIYLIYISVFIFLSRTRLRDTGLNRNWSLLIVSVFLASLMTHYRLYEYGFFIDSPINYALGNVTTSLITKIMVAFFFTLFLLPTKKANQHV